MEEWRKGFAKWLGDSLAQEDIKGIDCSERETLLEMLEGTYDPVGEDYFNDTIANCLKDWIIAGRLDDTLDLAIEFFKEHREEYIKEARRVLKEFYGVTVNE